MSRTKEEVLALRDAFMQGVRSCVRWGQDVKGAESLARVLYPLPRRQRVVKSGDYLYRYNAVTQLVEYHSGIDGFWYDTFSREHVTAMYDLINNPTEEDTE